MSSFLDFVVRSTEVSLDDVLRLLLGILVLPLAGDEGLVMVEETSSRGRRLVSSWTEIHGPDLCFSLMEREKSDCPYLILVLCFTEPFL